MNKKFKQLAIELQKEIQSVVAQFMFANIINGEEDTSDIINFILSAHLSSCFTLIKILSSEHKEMEEKTNKFREDVLKFIADNLNVATIEIISE